MDFEAITNTTMKSPAAPKWLLKIRRFKWW